MSAASAVIIENLDADHELYWSFIDSSGLLMLPQNLSPEVRQRMQVIHSNELQVGRIVWTGNMMRDFFLYLFNEHPIISMFKCDVLHRFTRNQRRVNFLLVTIYSFLFSLIIGVALLTYYAIPLSSSSNATIFNGTTLPSSSNCPNNTHFANVTACKYVESTDFFSITIISFIYIKIPRMIWNFIVFKLTTCRVSSSPNMQSKKDMIGFILFYMAAFSGLASCIYLLHQFYVVASNYTQAALIGYGLVIFFEYQPFSTFLFFRSYHMNIMKTGKKDATCSSCCLGSCCDCGLDARVKMLKRAQFSVKGSLVNDYWWIIDH